MYSLRLSAVAKKGDRLSFKVFLSLFATASRSAVKVSAIYFFISTFFKVIAFSLISYA